MAEIENIRILVFGAPSVGKTSLINLLVNKNFIEKDTMISLNRQGHKIAFQEYKCQKNGKNFIFTDIISFDKNDKTKFWHSEAQYHLQEFCSYINEGFNLVVHVITKQSLSETDQVNYELVVKENFKQQVKSLCIISCPDQEINLNYWNEKRNSLIQRSFFYDDGLAVTVMHAASSEYDKEFIRSRRISYDLLWNSILKLTHNSRKISPSFSMMKTIIYNFLDCFTDNFVTRFFQINNFLNSFFFERNPQIDWETKLEVKDLDDYQIIDMKE